MVDLQTNLVLTPEQAGLILQAWLGTWVGVTAIEPLQGGMINSVLRLRFDHPPYSAVIKLNGQEQDFAGEACALRHLHQRGFPCPDVYLLDTAVPQIPYSFLLLETLSGVSLAEVYLDGADRRRVERELAEVLVDLHAHARERFGPIDGEGAARWVDAFMPRLHRVRSEPEVEERLSPTVLRDVDRAIALAADLLEDQGVPTLIHGDIWAANVMVVEEADGWHLSGLVDPSAEYADVEMELAYLRGFQTVGSPFFEIYTAYAPLRPGHQLRFLVYWLRTYLIHVWLFGDQHYRDMTALVAKELVERTSSFSLGADW